MQLQRNAVGAQATVKQQTGTVSCKDRSREQPAATVKGLESKAVAVEGCSSERVRGRSMCAVMRMAPAPVPHGVAVHKTYHAGERHVQQLAGRSAQAEAVGEGSNGNLLLGFQQLSTFPQGVE